MDRAPESGLLFAGGLPRSGTSLLYALLNGHPEISLMYEAEVECAPGLLWRRAPDAVLRRLEFFNQVLSRHGIPAEDSLSHCRSSDDFARWCYSRIRERKAGAVWGGEKSPQYSSRLAALGRKFPEASFIVITRNLADTVASARKAAETGASFFRRGAWVSRNFRMGRKMLSAAGELIRAGRRVHFVSYEDLVTRPQEECSRLCAFLKIPDWPSMAELRKEVDAAVPEGPHHDRVRSGGIGPRAGQVSTLALADQVLCRRCELVLTQDLGHARGMAEHPPARPGIRLRMLEAEGAVRLWFDHVRLSALMLIPMGMWQFIRRVRHGDSKRIAQPPGGPSSDSAPSPAGQSSPLTMLRGGAAQRGLLLLVSGNPPADAAASVRQALQSAGIPDRPEFMHGLEELSACQGRTIVLMAGGAEALASSGRDLLAEAASLGIQVGFALFPHDGRCVLGFPAADASTFPGGPQGRCQPADRIPARQPLPPPFCDPDQSLAGAC